MKQLLTIQEQVPEFEQLLANLENGRSPVAVSGLSPVHRAHFAAGLGFKTERPVVLVCADEAEAVRLGEDYTAFTGISPVLITAREFLFHDGATASRQWEHQRLSAFYKMAAEEAPLVIATVEGLLQRTLSPEELADHVVTVETNGQYDLNDLADRLAALGYTRCEQVEGVGQFALRGGILDVYSPAQDHPVRIEFWDQDVDSMGLFDVSSQRRVSQIKKAVFLPVSEILPVQQDGSWVRLSDRLLPTRYDHLTTAAHHLPPDAVVCFSESGRVAERAKNWLWQLVRM